MSFRPRFLVPWVLFAATIVSLPAWAAPPREIPGEVLVKFRPTARAADRASARGQVQGRALRDFSFISVEHLKVDGMSAQQAIERLRRNPHVEYAEPNYEVNMSVVPNDTATTSSTTTAIHSTTTVTARMSPAPSPAWATTASGSPACAGRPRSWASSS